MEVQKTAHKRSETQKKALSQQVVIKKLIDSLIKEDKEFAKSWRLERAISDEKRLKWELVQQLLMFLNKQSFQVCGRAVRAALFTGHEFTEE